jgi:secreted PhoX family phosphatase
LCVNHEYTHEAILHPDGLDEQSGGLPGSVATIAKIRKSQAAHGVSVIEIRRNGNKWQVVKNSRYNRRITANTPMKLSGPAAGHALMKTNEYNITPRGSIPTGRLTDGRTAYGTANNCAHGYTPWGTYLTCEENWNGYFGWKNAGHAQTKLENRYGVSQNGFTTNVGRGSTSVYKWHIVDDRWDTDINPNEPNHFGWCVEIDPFDPNSVPVKRTTMGRFKHEGATFAVDRSNRIAFYMGDDERNEYIYKFVCANPFNPRDRSAKRDLLDQGTLYVAKFTSGQGQSPNSFRGEWIPLTPDTIALNGQPLRANPEFSGESAGANDAEVQALILIKTRMAADAVGATMMDRPEWTAVRPQVNGYNQLEVYCTLTNNSRRGNTPPSANNPDGSTRAASANPPVDAANPRPDNDYGHIIRWREDGNTPTARGFDWEIFVLCGDTQVGSYVPSPKTLPSTYNPNDLSGVGYVGNIQDVPNGSADFGAPDGLWFDEAGRLWIQTDQQGDGAGDWQKIGSNVMMCADPNTKEIRRFLTSPSQCEVTGVITTPDGRTMFVGIQHPGEEGLTADPDQFSNWPASQFGGPGGRPRSSVLAITRQDGGVIGGL